MLKKENVTIKKSDFIKQMQNCLKESGSSSIKKNHILEIYDAMLSTLKHFMLEARDKKKKNQDSNVVVRFSKFGSFSVSVRPACVYSNPQTRKKIKKPASFRVRFIASELMKNKLND